MTTLLEVAVGLQYDELPEHVLLVLCTDGRITRIPCADVEFVHRLMALFLGPREGPVAPLCEHRYLTVRKIDRDVYEECQLCGAPRIELHLGM